MKNILFLCFLFVALGCSNDDSTDNVGPGDPQQQDPDPTYTFKINGQDSDIFDFGPLSFVENNGNIQAGFDPPTVGLAEYFLTFNKQGKFGKLSVELVQPDGTSKVFTSFRNYNSKFFDFKILSLDEAKKRVKFEFSGLLYRNPDDLNSESKYVAGTFDVNYTGFVAPVSDIRNTATINGIPWTATSNYALRGPNETEYFYYTLHTLSNDEYKILIRFDQVNTIAGIYNFTNDDVERVQILKFNLNTNSYIVYNCSGTLEVTQKWLYFIEGKYHFTGVNINDPTDVINVTDGNFKLEFPQY